MSNTIYTYTTKCHKINSYSKQIRYLAIYNAKLRKGLWWKILLELQSKKIARTNIVICDSSTFKYHRHGGGQKGGYNQKEEVYQD